MRRRLLLSSIAVTLVSLVLLCVPLGLVADSLIRQDFTHRLDRNLQNVAAAIAEISAQGRSVTSANLAALVPADRRVIYTPDDGPVLMAGHTSGAVQTATTTVGSAKLQMQAPRSLLDARLLNIWLLIAGLGLLALVFAVALSLWSATRLNRPLAALAITAEKLGRGDLRPSGARYQIKELDTLAEVLDRSATRLAQIIDDERRFSRETSHQLRTPLTSLTVRLEEIRRASQDQHIRDEAEAGLQQIERLTEVVSSALSRQPTAATAREIVDIGILLLAQQREWEPAYRRAGRQLNVQSEPGIQARATPGGVEQALSTLIDNALTHGDGATTLSSRNLGSHIMIEVSDEGPGVPEDLGQRIFVRDVSGGTGTGIGLPLARSIIEADGGRLELTQQHPPRFTIFLPASTPTSSYSNLSDKSESSGDPSTE